MNLMASRRLLFLLAGIIIVANFGVIAVILPDLNRVSTSTSSVTLPAGCVKPAGGFLIIASQLGFNDSVNHGVPEDNWPVMNVRLGQNVTIVVCNADPSQAHGFQVDHYYVAQLVSVASGQVLRVSFIATQAGSFRVYCQIFCTIHWAMQSGQLVVT
jgi:hypothetical protein